VAHNEGAECSNMGLCDRTTGLCVCRVGWSGISCNRMDCPKDEAGILECSGHGSCMSVEQAARIQNDVTLFNSFTYTNWDAHMIYGCFCDEGRTNFDCSLRACPKGEDHGAASALDEIQVMSGGCGSEHTQCTAHSTQRTEHTAQRTTHETRIQHTAHSSTHSVQSLVVR
jgi:hypothetical protein